MAAFPTDYACVTDAKYSEILPNEVNYLGGTTYTEKAQVSISILIKNDADMRGFRTWYLANGNAPFTITLPLFGETQNYNVEFTHPLSISRLKTGGREFNATLGVLDVI